MITSYFDIIIEFFRTIILLGTFDELVQSAITCSKLTIETLEQGNKYAQS